MRVNCLLLLLLWLVAGCTSRIEWIEDKERYYAVERSYDQKLWTVTRQ